MKKPVKKKKQVVKFAAEKVERNCFSCNGHGFMCNVCGEAGDSCGHEDGTYECENCKGTGRVMCAVPL